VEEVGGVKEVGEGEAGDINREKNMTGAKKYRDLVAWQKANELAFRIYKLTDNFPAEYAYDITNQLRRSVLSIPTNLAEGCASLHTKELL